MMHSEQMQRLRSVLAAYGADPGRWPTVDRDALGAFVSENGEARALVEAEAAFDGLLNSASAGADRSAAERASALLFARLDGDTEDHASAHGSNVVPFVPKPNAKTPARAYQQGASARGVLKELSVLAAALLIGFFTVSQGLLEGTGLDLGGDGVVASGESYDAGEIALGSADEGAEEDLL
jgi:hypothetical protein